MVISPAGAQSGPNNNAAPAAKQAQGKPKLYVIGLKRWTVDMINDTLSKYYPNTPEATLYGHACAGVLKERGFANALPIYWPGMNGTMSRVVLVVEPQDSALVAPNPPITTARDIPDDWKAAIQPFMESRTRVSKSTGDTIVHVSVASQLRRLISTYHLFAAGQADSARRLLAKGKKPVTPEQESLWQFMQRNNTREARDYALDLLENDSVFQHRVLAAAVLTNFDTDTAVWGALVHALRDPEPMVAGQAEHVLQTWIDAKPRTVDWSPWLADIRAVLGGRSFFGAANMMEMLVETNVDRSLAKPLLEGNTGLVFGYAGGILFNKEAQGFLTHLSGKKFGSDVAQWQTWLNSL